jgi:phosphoglycerol transferase MdoB-like AlkP superfamily enzyme
MPNLNRLKRKGIWFSHCYGNSFRTDRGTVCALSGYPSFPTTSVMKIPKKAGTLPSIAKTLQKAGYATSYLYGGDINFTNMRSYLIATGWEQLHWKADYTSEEQSSAKWGVRDDITFKTLFDQICATDSTQRFLMGYSTLSSHEPWDVPIHKYNDKEKNAFSYLDDCIGKFVSQLKGTP